jgi:hypothetical protein
LIVAITHRRDRADLEIVRLLLQNGADPNQGILLSQLMALSSVHQRAPWYKQHGFQAPDLTQDKHQKRILPIDVCAACGDLDALIELLNAMDMANVAESECCLISALRTAVKEQSDIVACLVTAGANIHQKDEHGNTALHLAVQGDFVLSIAILLYAGVKINATGRDQRTPLDMATKGTRAYTYLLAHGAQHTTTPIAGKVDVIFTQDDIKQVDQEAVKRVQGALQVLAPMRHISGRSSSYTPGEKSHHHMPTSHSLSDLRMRSNSDDYHANRHLLEKDKEKKKKHWSVSSLFKSSK